MTRLDDPSVAGLLAGGPETCLGMAGMIGRLFLLLIGASAFAGEPMQYPETRKDDMVDDYHGTKVADPYRYLEDTDSPETKAWVAAENKLTFGYLAGLPDRAGFRAKLTNLLNFERF